MTSSELRSGYRARLVCGFRRRAETIFPSDFAYSGRIENRGKISRSRGRARQHARRVRYPESRGSTYNTAGVTAAAGRFEERFRFANQGYAHRPAFESPLTRVQRQAVRREKECGSR
jgi:hypothetical protein